VFEAHNIAFAIHSDQHLKSRRNQHINVGLCAWASVFMLLIASRSGAVRPALNKFAVVLLCCAPSLRKPAEAMQEKHGKCVTIIALAKFWGTSGERSEQACRKMCVLAA
jgi:hypothetical protein